MTVYTYGVFDLFHVGHSRLLHEAAALGERLIVGVYTDEVAAGFKRTPIIPFAERMEMVANHKAVDEVVVQEHFLPDTNIRQYKPDILAKADGAGWGEIENVPGTQEMLKLGGKIVHLPYHDGISTSDIIKEIRLCS